MKKFFAFMLALVMLMSLVACGASNEPAPAPAEPEAVVNTIPLAFLFKNKTGKDIKEAYVYPAGAEDKGENILSAVWANNKSDSDYLWTTIERPEADAYDIEVVFTDDTNAVFAAQDLKSNNSVSMKDDGSISVKNDSDIGPDGKPVAPAEPEKPAEVEVPAEVALSFNLKNKEEDMGAINSLKIVPTGTSAADAENLLAEPVKGSAKVEATIPGAAWYDVVVEFEQGTKVLVGVPFQFDKISMKDGGASIADEAAGVEYVINMDGGKCKSSEFKSQDYVEPAGAAEVGGEVALSFNLKNKEEDMGAVVSLKIVPTGTDAADAENLLAEPVKGSAKIEATVPGAEWYDVVVEFEQGTKVLVGVSASFDKISLKDGGASISDEAAGVEYVPNMDGGKCKSSEFKYQ